MHTRPPVPVFGAVRRGPPLPTPRQRGGPRRMATRHFRVQVFGES